MNKITINPHLYKDVKIKTRTEKENLQNVYNTFLWHGVSYLVKNDLDKACYWMYIKQPKTFEYRELPQSTMKHYMRKLIKYKVIEVERMNE